MITERTELEAERQTKFNGFRPWMIVFFGDGPNGSHWYLLDYINFTKEAEFEYMPVSYQTGTYDQKMCRTVVRELSRPI